MKNILLLFFIMISLFSCKKDESVENIEIEIDNFKDKDINLFYKDREYNLVILNYWATYCSPCKVEMADFVKLNSMYKDRGLLVIGATQEGEESLSLINKLCKILKVNYPILYQVKNSFGGETILGLPTTYIIAKNGDIIEKIDGKRDYNYFHNIVKKYCE